MVDCKAEDPPRPADPHARTFDIEKHGQGIPDSTPVPQQNIAHGSSGAARGSSLMRGLLSFALRTVFIVAMVFWLTGNGNKGHGTKEVGDLQGVAGEDASVSAYWYGIADKGMRAAVKTHDQHGSPKHKHHEHDEHKHKHGDKHDHHHGPGKSRHGPLFIPPKKAERIFLSVPNNDSVRDASRRYTSHAHIAGSGWDYLSAIQLKAEWEAALGLHISGPEEHVLESGSPESQARVRDSQDKIGVWVDTYYPYMNTPVESKVTLYTEPPFHAQLKEDIIPGDPDSQLRDEVRAFHGLSANGDVTAKYVYAGYGRKKDYELLAERGIDVNGKIVLVKYGGVFRGLKIEAAQDAGAIGVIIFTDPGDDGEFTEDHGYTAYPDGPARQPSSIQRGSVQFLSKYPGDPTTPNIPSYRNVTRSEASSMPRIPSLPISFQDAIPLLRALNGKGVKGTEISADWNGGLGYKGVEYWVGPSEVDLRLRNEVNNRVMPIWNTMATIPGHISDEIVIVGNHRDAWVLGAGDPSSGTASLTELVKGLGALLRKGWRPMRTIILASWDAEEYGLMGSTEFAEDHGDWLANRTAAYLNMDESVVGSRFAANASPSLAWLLRNAATDVLSSSNHSKTVWDARLDQGDASRWTSSIPVEERSQAIVAAAEEELMTTSAEDELEWIRPLGSGSDFTPFLQHYGIASGNIGFTGGKGDSVYHYHSVYDSFTWQEKFADPGFHKHVDAAKVLGLMTLRLADSPALPVNTTHYAHELLYYLHVVRGTANATGIDQLDLSPLQSAIEQLIESSSQLDKRRIMVLKELKHLLPKPHPGKRRKLQTAWDLCISSLPDSLRAILPGHAQYSAPIETAVQPFAVDPIGPSGIDKTDWPEIPLIDTTFFANLSDGANDQTPHAGLGRQHRRPDPHSHVPRKQREKIAKALKELRGINQNVRSFERGFISQNGIKGREWYRHKGVAPGKWLGYGATTFPALTEAITLDKSADLAQKEADELVQLITDMSRHLAA